MLSENIKAYRKLKGWTQEKMSVEFGLTRDNIASYERGIAKPTLEFACQICDEIKVSLHDLLYGEILNPKLEAERNDGMKALEDELQKAYRTIAKMTQEKMNDDESPLSIVAKDGPKE